MHRFVEGFVLQGGDVTRGDGSGGESICESSTSRLQFPRPRIVSFLNLRLLNESQHYTTFNALHLMADITGALSFPPSIRSRRRNPSRPKTAPRTAHLRLPLLRILLLQELFFFPVLHHPKP